MFELLLFLCSALVRCDGGATTQQLVFGVGNKKDGSLFHYCDILLTPTGTITSAIIFLKTGGEDNAVPKCPVQPESSPSSPGFTRLKIPDSLDKDGVYSFHITCSDGRVLDTETWRYDPKSRQFSHASAIKTPIWATKVGKIILISCGVVLLFAMSYILYRVFRKNKAAL